MSCEEDLFCGLNTAKSESIEEMTDFERYLGTPRWVLGDGTVAFETDRDGTLAQALIIGLIAPQPKDGSPYRVATTSRDLHIWVSDPYGQERTLVSAPQDRCFDPSLSPQQDRVCYTVLDHGGSIAVADIDGDGNLDIVSVSLTNTGAEAIAWENP